MFRNNSTKNWMTRSNFVHLCKIKYKFFSSKYFGGKLFDLLVDGVNDLLYSCRTPHQALLWPLSMLSLAYTANQHFPWLEPRCVQWAASPNNVAVWKWPYGRAFLQQQQPISSCFLLLHQTVECNRKIDVKDVQALFLSKDRTPMEGDKVLKLLKDLVKVGSYPWFHPRRLRQWRSCSFWMLQHSCYNGSHRPPDPHHKL